MALETATKVWVPSLVAITGTLFSILLAYILWKDIDSSFTFLLTLEDYTPLVVLILGTAISLLIAALIKLWQTSRHRALTLDAMHEDLKNSISERIQAEDTKQKLEIALLQGQKLQAMGTLAGGIAHDFNNLLYAIIGYVEMARDDVEKDSLVYNNLGKVLEASHRGQELVSRILSFSRRQHQDLNPIELKSTIEAALALLRPTIPAGVSINFDAMGETPILGNQTQIHQVFVNIINNAVDAMDGEGTINIQVSHLAPDDPYLNQFPEAHAKRQKYCKIDISDSGHGMDQHIMERIFEPFYTTKEVGKGTGLGLSIVHSIVKDHGGDISVASQLGHGTTFTILLPEYSVE